MSKCASTRETSSPIPTGSSRPATTTSPPARWPSARAKPTTRPRSPPCSSRSSPTAERAAGAGSSASANPAVPELDGVAARSIGVEEELLRVDSASGRGRAVAEVIMRAEQPAARPPEGSASGEPGRVLDFEIKLEQLETGTRPCTSLDELGREVRRSRSVAAEAAGRAGVRVAALGTSPMVVAPSLTLLNRYRRMSAEFGLTAQEQLTCGCHVHVDIGSDDEGGAGPHPLPPWLPPPLALCATPPSWQGCAHPSASPTV